MCRDVIVPTGPGRATVGCDLRGGIVVFASAVIDLDYLASYDGALAGATEAITFAVAAAR